MLGYVIDFNYGLKLIIFIEVYYFNIWDDCILNKKGEMIMSKYLVICGYG